MTEAAEKGEHLGPTPNTPLVGIVILAAGRGTRLGHAHPKALTELATGESIMGRQLSLIRKVLPAPPPVTIVVGFKFEMIMESYANQLFIYNERFDSTNTAVSLAKALSLLPPGGVLWLNGDLVLDPGALKAVASGIAGHRSICCVNTGSVGDEEVKYSLDKDGYIEQISKEVVDARGEAVGINYVAERDRESFYRSLLGCGDDDYFERAIEQGTSAGLFRFEPLDVSSHLAIEVDFVADLEAANQRLLAHGASERLGTDV